MRLIILTILFLFTAYTSNSQICATLDGWSLSSDNEDGTCTYSVSVIVDSGSNSKGLVTFSIDGIPVFVESDCICNPTTITFPITVACGSTVIIDVDYEGPGSNDCTGSTGDIILPVKWISINVKNDGKFNELTWTVVEENNCDKYIIERSPDGINFLSIGEIVSNGIDHESINYTFIDDEPLLGYNYYRIKQIDYDNQYSYSDVVYKRLEQRTEYQLYPNPFSELINIKSDNTISWNLRQSNGILILSGHEDFINTSLLAPGIYYIEIVDKENHFVEKLLKY